MPGIIQLRKGFFKGAEADARAGRSDISPGTDRTGGLRGDRGNPGGDGPKAPPSILNPEPKPSVFEQIKGIPDAFRTLSLKNLYDQKMGIKSFGPSIFGTIASVTNPQLNVYEATDPTLDQYGMTGKDLIDIDRLSAAINTAETQGITQKDFNDAFFGKDNPRNPNNITQTGGGDGGGITTLPYILPTTTQAIQQEEPAENSFYEMLRRNLGLV